MKILLLSLLMIVVTAEVESQSPELAPIGATWQFTGRQFTPDLHTAVFQSMDAGIIDSQACKRIKLVDDPFGWEFPDFYLYRDSVKMYFSMDSVSWQVLYDFSKNVGDTFYSAYWENWPTIEIFPVVVAATGDTLINGFLLPTIQFYSLDLDYFFSGSAIMNIGSNSFLLPWSGLWEMQYDGLRCYNDTVIGSYQPLLPCDTTYIYLSTPGLGHYEEMQIYPNPAKQTLNVRFTSNSNKKIQISIYDIMGYPLGNWSIQSSSQTKALQIDLTKFPEGIYFLESQNDGSKQVAKVIHYN